MRKEFIIGLARVPTAIVQIRRRETFYMQMTSAKILLIGGICFLTGLLIGLNPSERKRGPKSSIDVDFCFLAANRELFVRHSVNTTAEISINMHGALLSSSACPNLYLSYSVSPTNITTKPLLEHRTPYEPVLKVSFTGTVNPLPEMQTLARLKYALGLAPKYPGAITIEQVAAVNALEN